ncbi:MAG: hypothetical protein GY801_17440 [bacterium]|nr:hypothetical protein [bacterium]
MKYIFDARFLDLPEFHASREFEIEPKAREKLDALFQFIWPDEKLDLVRSQFQELISAAQRRLKGPENADRERWSEKQAVLICYGDHIRSQQPGTTPLQALGEFCRQQFGEDAFSQLTIHLLPIYSSPYKDGGFDIADPFAVNPKMGSWEDVRLLSDRFNVAVDFVANHLSVASPWFERYLDGDPVFKDFFIGFDDENSVRKLEKEALPNIYRPRPHNPFIPVKKADGSTRWVYMTFSDHQADINYAKPFVFLKMTEVLLFYILHGVNMVRLDAIPYLWKEWGTPCAHHPRTHALVELTRLACDLVNPAVKLLAESMEPLADSKRYLSSDKTAKAHLAYNFVPCGLIPHSLVSEDASVFQRNIMNFSAPGDGVNWAVVCGVTHDGSSINPCRAPQSAAGEAVLAEEQIEAVARYYSEHGTQELQQRCQAPASSPEALPEDFAQQFLSRHGEAPRFANYKSVTDAQGRPQQIVYEAISTYASLFDRNPEKIVAALGMALGLPGIPFVYFTSPFAMLNDFQYYLETGNPRELNRGRVVLEELQQQFQDQSSLSAQVFSRYKKFLQVRVSQPAFHPEAELIPLAPDNPAIIAFLRRSLDKGQKILLLQNISSIEQQFELALPQDPEPAVRAYQDLIGGETLTMPQQQIRMKLPPWAIRWLDLLPVDNIRVSAE